jgi:hypothetical protein
VRALAGPRFGIETTFIIVVAAVGGLLELPLIVVVCGVFGAWIVVALAEVVFSRRAARMPAQPAGAAAAGVVEPEGERPALAAVPEPMVEPEPEPPWADAEPAPVADSSPEPRAWNVWDLQRRLQSRAGSAAADDLNYLLLYLREYASPDGDLPVEFDALVRDSFGDLVAPDR